jgi:hypothetical protein
MRRSLPVAALVLGALVLTACGGRASAPSPSTTSAQQQRPELLPVSQSPLKVEGTGFQPGEEVRIEVDAPNGQAKHTRASSSGSFTTDISELTGCGSVTVTATGSQGSVAEFNFSQIAC